MFSRFRWTERQTEGESSLSVALPLPLLPCDVFWPDSMAPGRQWHDHRNRGQKGHSSLLVNLEMSLAILACAFCSSFVKCFIFSIENNNTAVQHVGRSLSCGRAFCNSALLIRPSLSWKSTFDAHFIKYE